jgi:hypothetical protein
MRRQPAAKGRIMSARKMLMPAALFACAIGASAHAATATGSATESSLTRPDVVGAGLTAPLGSTKGSLTAARDATPVKAPPPQRAAILDGCIYVNVIAKCPRPSL